MHFDSWKCSNAVQVHHVQFRFQIGFGKKISYTNNGIDARDVNLTIERANLVPKLLDACWLGKVGTNRRDLDPAFPKLGRSDLQLLTRRIDNEIVSTCGEFVGE